MDRSEEASVIKNITRGIVQECEQRGHPVSDTLVTFLVKALLVDPGRDVDPTLTKQHVQRIKQLCVDKLGEKLSPSLDTIKMQLHFHMKYSSRNVFLEELHGVLESKLSALSREVTDVRMKSRHELDALYHKITTYILLRSALGSPADAGAVEEASAALQSIFPKTELGAFMVLLKQEKEELLKEFALTVTGIRLFNMSNKNGDEEFNVHHLMPAALHDNLPAATESLTKQLSETRRLAWRYTAVLEKLTDPELQAGPPDAPLVLLTQALYNARQHEAFLHILLTDAGFCVRRVESLQKEICSQLQLLRQKLKPKTAVPTAVVSPLFKALSKLWFGVQDEAELLSILGNMAASLQPFLASQAKFVSDSSLKSLLEAAEVKTDDQRRAESSGQQVDPTQQENQEWLKPGTKSSFNQLQYNGFCPYTLVRRSGLLLPGNPAIGVLKHKEKLYAFSSKQAALEFAACPDDFTAAVAERTRCFPDLVHLLHLYQQFSHVSAHPEMQQEESLLANSIIRCEIGTQTVLHPTESNMDKSYEWNEWALRRKALQLADLRTKITRSVQTDLSHMRRENVSQTWLPKDAESQSRRDAGSGAPKPQTYLAGLRGQRDARVVKTDLTRSVDE